MERCGTEAPPPDLLSGVDWEGRVQGIDRPFIECSARVLAESNPGHLPYTIASQDDPRKLGCAWHPVATVIRQANRAGLLWNLANSAGFPSPRHSMLTYCAIRGDFRSGVNDHFQLLYWEAVDHNGTDLVVEITSAHNADTWGAHTNAFELDPLRCSKLLGSSPQQDIAHSYFPPHIGQPDSPVVFERVKQLLSEPRDHFRGTLELFK